MYRISFQLDEKKSDEVTYIKERVDVNDNKLDIHDVLIQVKTCCFKRMQITQIVKRLFLAHKSCGVGGTGVGVVKRLGSGITDIKVDSQVVFLLPETSRHSGVSNFCVVPRYLCFACPATIDPTETAVTVDALIPTYCALKNRVGRGDTVLVIYPHTQCGQMIIQTLHQRGCKIVVYISKEEEIDFISPYRHIIDHIFKGWLYRSNVKEVRASLMKECDNFGYSMILCLPSLSPENISTLAPANDRISNNSLNFTSTVLLLAVGGHLVCTNPEQVVSKELSSNMFAKGCSLHYLNPATCLLSPHRLGTLLNYLNNGLTLLQTKDISPPTPIRKLTLEEAVVVLNNKSDQMDASYVVEF